jgi:hypothetical protein
VRTVNFFTPVVSCLFTLLLLPLQGGNAQQSDIPIRSAWQFGNSSGQAGDILYAGYGGTFYQVLTTTPAQMQEYKPGYATAGIYELKFSVANYFQSYPGYYTAEVDFGTQELCETSGWGMPSFTEIILDCPAPSYIIVDNALASNGVSSPVQGQSPIAIHFTVGGWTLLFNNVSLTFTPSQ